VRVVHRLDAEAVARKEELTFAPVPDGDREHPAQLRGKRLAHALVQVQHRFGVAMRAVLHPLRLELGHQRGVVVHLPVVDDVEAPVGRGHGLGPVRHVHDAQAPMAERDSWVKEDPLAVGPPVPDDIAHAPHLLFGGAARASGGRHDAADPAHGSLVR
jgi:hypothetical protein